MDNSALETDPDVIASFFDEVSDGLTSISQEPSDPDGMRELANEQREFRIRLANTEDRRESASILINKMYSWRGYDNSGPLSENPNRITLIATGNDNKVIGTVSVGLDSPMGLLADEMYHEELEVLRSHGRKICEFNSLAIDPSIKSKRVIAALFQIVILYPSEVFGYTDGVLEVNPRHVRFYERMMGFTQLGPERICPRVNAPSILMRADFSYVNAQAEKLGGLMEKAKNEKSLYPYFFHKVDTNGILGRLKAMA